MKKTLMIAVLGFMLTGVACDAQQQQQQQVYDPNPMTIDPQKREEMKQTYREAAREMKRLAGEFRSFYDELKTVVEEEGIADIGKDLGFSKEPDESAFGSADVTDYGKEMVVQMDMPGIEKKDISIRLKDRYELEVEAERPKVDAARTLVKNERYKGSFQRTIKLPAQAADKGFKAELQNGVLTIRIPKENPNDPAKVQSIEIS